ncbi:MAG: TIGR03862 family flavoprotein, partial [Pseudomonadota bacterium]
MAAETIATKDDQADVTIYEQMPRPARKFLLAGRGGLNLSNAAAPSAFFAAFRDGSSVEPGPPATLNRALQMFDRTALEAWCKSLAIETFVGSSGRVFPIAMKASPLLRAWLRRLDEHGVKLRTRHKFIGIERDGALAFQTPDGLTHVAATAAVFATGGASWPRLGSDGDWRTVFAEHGVKTRPFQPSNVGVMVRWSDHLRATTAGQPLKRVAVTVGGKTSRGELIITEFGLEGGPIYALSPELRQLLDGRPRSAVDGSDRRDMQPTLSLDLRPDLSAHEVAQRLRKAKSAKSLSTNLKSAAGLSAAAARLLREHRQACDQQRLRAGQIGSSNS